jgi:hypothetical protein
LIHSVRHCPVRGWKGARRNRPIRMATGARGQGLRQGDHSPAGWPEFMESRRRRTHQICAPAVLSARRPFRCPSAPPELIRDASGARRSCRSTAAQRAHAGYPREGARGRAPRYGTESQRPRQPLARNTHGPRTLPALPPMRSSPSTVLPKPPSCARATVSNPIRLRQGNDPYGSRRQPSSVGSEFSSLFEALVAAIRLRLDLATLPSRLQVQNWHQTDMPGQADDVCS